MLKTICKAMKKILIIEDDAHHLRMLKAVLTKENYEVLVASNGQEGCRMYEDNPCDLVISDIFMPEKEGLETITDLKESHPDAKIIAISGGGAKSQFMMDDILKMAKDLGADTIMAKPLDIPTLVQNIQLLIGKSAEA